MAPDDMPLERSLERLQAEGAVRALRRGEGSMARLGSEDGVPKLDWVEGTARLLENERWLEEVEAEAAAIVEGGFRHIIWSGMGGSVMTVRVLTDLGLCAEPSVGLVIHPLDSTDPAALNALIRGLADEKGVALDPTAELDDEQIRKLFSDVMMIAVSMGMTSEEPITHLEWFVALLEAAGLPPGRHCLVMTLAGSYLDRFAAERGLPSRLLQLDGGSGTGGRMSAPTTRVFLLPAALALLTRGSPPGSLRAVLERAWALYDLDLATTDGSRHPFVRLAAALDAASVDGACLALLSFTDRAHVLVQWIEQLMEESLGKGGRGVVVFDGQRLNADAACFRAEGTLEVVVGEGAGGEEAEPAGGHGATEGRRSIAIDFGGADAFDGNGTGTSRHVLEDGDVGDLLAAVAAQFLGCQLAMALYGYLHDIQFAGQPAVEAYKTRARELREGDPVGVALSEAMALQEGPLTLLVPPGSEAEGGSPASVLAAALQRECPLYLDLTINGELADETAPGVRAAIEHLGNTVLGVPIKLRRAPAAYHSTEQSEMDGPPGLVSLRIVALQHEQAILGAYSDAFLLAQAVGTWQAMVESGRSCFLLLLDGSLAGGSPAVVSLLESVAREMESGHDLS